MSEPVSKLAVLESARCRTLLPTDFMKRNDFRVLFKTSLSQLWHGDKCHLKRVTITTRPPEVSLNSPKTSRKNAGQVIPRQAASYFSTPLPLPRKSKSDSAADCSGPTDACRGSQQNLAGTSTQKLGTKTRLASRGFDPANCS